MNDRVPALLPVSPPERTKGRLAGLLTPEERSWLARATFATVASAVAGAGFEPIVVAASAAAVGGVGDLRVLVEHAGRSGLNAALEDALSDLGEVPMALVVHADLPLASEEALRKLRAALPGTGEAVVLVRSRDGGTNAMLQQPPGRFPLAYGSGSFARHAAAAWASGLSVSAVDDPVLSLDLDTPDDVQVLLSLPDGRRSPAGRLLLEWGVGARLPVDSSRPAATFHRR